MCQLAKLVMAETAKTEPIRGALATDTDVVLNTLGAAILVIDSDLILRYVNTSAEQLFQSGSRALVGQTAKTLLFASASVLSLMHQAVANDTEMLEYGVTFESPKTGEKIMTVHVTPMIGTTDRYVVSMVEQTRALRIGQQLEYRQSVRSVTAMAAILAHEVKNPLSGIRGAAQLLEQGVSEEDRVLTTLIRDEADRIVSLVDRMEVFSDERPLNRASVNIHQVLEHVRRVAENGFARHIEFIEDYDPSLPAVSGHKDQLIQAFLNLVKNASEAVPHQGGEIRLSTGYRQGIRVAIPGTNSRLRLPLVVTIQDNGFGIADDLRSHLFDPFVTTKHHGKGLGLALVAKIVQDHGGIIEFDSQPRRTVFRIMLPIMEKS